MNVEITQELDNTGPFFRKKVIVDGVDISSIVSNVQVNINGSEPTFAKICLSNIADYMINMKAEDIYIENIPFPRSFKEKLYEKLKEEFERIDKDGEDKIKP